MLTVETGTFVSKATNKIVVQTDSSGLAAVRIVAQTTGTTDEDPLLQDIPVTITPAKLENGVTLLYDAAGCDGATGEPVSDCPRALTVRHGSDQTSASYTDLTVITLSGRVPFWKPLGNVVDADCFVPDLKVEVFDSANTLLTDSTTDALGTFSVVVQQNQPVTIRFERATAPEYIYVAKAGSRDSILPSSISVSGKNADTVIDVPFMCASRVDAATGKPANIDVSMPLVGGHCELQLADAVDVSLFQLVSASCNNGDPLSWDVGELRGVQRCRRFVLNIT